MFEIGKSMKICTSLLGSGWRGDLPFTNNPKPTPWKPWQFAKIIDKVGVIIVKLQVFLIFLGIEKILYFLNNISLHI